MSKIIIMYETALYANKKANTLPKGNMERQKLIQMIDDFNKGKIVDVFDDPKRAYSILNIENNLESLKL